MTLAVSSKFRVKSVTSAVVACTCIRCCTDALSEVRCNVEQFHACRSLASISETVAPPAGSKDPVLRRLSEPLARVCTCPSVCHMTDMEGTITFVVPELSEKTLMNVSFHIPVLPIFDYFVFTTVHF